MKKIFAYMLIMFLCLLTVPTFAAGNGSASNDKDAMYKELRPFLRAWEILASDIEDLSTSKVKKDIDKLTEVLKNFKVKPACDKLISDMHKTLQKMKFHLAYKNFISISSQSKKLAKQFSDLHEMCTGAKVIRYDGRRLGVGIAKD